MLNIFEAFAGIGSWHRAFERCKIPHDIVGFSEIDPYAIKAYCAIHGEPESKSYGDIAKIDEFTEPIDVICASPPCQSYSAAGKHLGTADPRGQLFFETLRVVDIAKPKIVLIENVKGLTAKRFADTLSDIIASLESMGYNVYTKVLNSKDFGIPQSRARLFFVCILREIDDGSFEFPEPIPLTITLRDLLDKNVPEKYFINDDYFIKWKDSFERDIKRSFSGLDRDVAVCQLARQYSNSRGNFVTDKLQCIGLISGRNSQGTRVYADNISCTLSALGGGLAAKTGAYIDNNRIRKLTPKECLRLMDFEDEDYERLCEIQLSDSQIYRRAGNAIVVGVVCAILEKLKPNLERMKNYGN
jgi:DNA (cytosine-5)-methyltransferase 1